MLTARTVGVIFLITSLSFSWRLSEMISQRRQGKIEDETFYDNIFGKGEVVYNLWRHISANVSKNHFFPIAYTM